MIPCALLIESQDFQALDLLTAPRAVAVRLRRCVKYHLAAGTKHSREERDVEDVESATWWPSTAGQSSDSCTRRLDGEIRLGKDLKPSDAIAHFSISVSVLHFVRCRVANNHISIQWWFALSRRLLLTPPIQISIWPNPWR